VYLDGKIDTFMVVFNKKTSYEERDVGCLDYIDWERDYSD